MGIDGGGACHRMSPPRILQTGVNLKLKRSVLLEKFVRSFFGNSNTFSLLKLEGGFDKYAMPAINIYAVHYDSMYKPLKGDKLRNMVVMLDSYVNKERLPVQLIAALQNLGVSYALEDNSEVRAYAKYDAQEIRVGTPLGTAEGTSRDHAYLWHVHGVTDILDENLVEKSIKAPDSGLRTMLLRKRPRIQQ